MEQKINIPKKFTPALVPTRTVGLSTGRRRKNLANQVNRSSKSAAETNLAVWTSIFQSCKSLSHQFGKLTESGNPAPEEIAGFAAKFIENEDVTLDLETLANLLAVALTRGTVTEAEIKEATSKEKLEETRQTVFSLSFAKRNLVKGKEIPVALESRYILLNGGKYLSVGMPVVYTIGFFCITAAFCCVVLPNPWQRAACMAAAIFPPYLLLLSPKIVGK